MTDAIQLVAATLANCSNIRSWLKFPADVTLRHDAF